MKMAKRMVALALAVMLVAAVMIVPASAASSTWVDRFKNFTMTSQTSYQSGYASAIQSILLGYSATKSYIEDYGGVDGMFGAKTKEAVKIFQSAYSLGADGIVGSGTWSKMAEVMSTSSDGSTTNFTMGSRTAITAKYASSTYNFYYRTTAGALGSVFHTSY